MGAPSELQTESVEEGVDTGGAAVDDKVEIDVVNSMPQIVPNPDVGIIAEPSIGGESTMPEVPRLDQGIRSVVSGRTTDQANYLFAGHAFLNGEESLFGDSGLLRWKHKGHGATDHGHDDREG